MLDEDFLSGFSPLNVRARSLPLAEDIREYRDLMRSIAEIDQQKSSEEGLAPATLQSLNTRRREAVRRRFELVRENAPYQAGDVLVDVTDKTRLVVSDVYLAQGNELGSKDVRFELRIQTPDGIDLDYPVLQTLQVRPSLSAAGEISLRSGHVNKMLSQQLEIERWDQRSAKAFEDLEITFLTEFLDNNVVEKKMYKLSTKYGRFLIFMRGDDIETVALEHIIHSPNGGIPIFIDLEDEEYSRRLKSVLVRELASYEKVSPVGLTKFKIEKGRMYVPMIRGQEDREAFADLFQSNIFLRHLVENSGLLERDLSLAGVYYFIADEKRRHHRGAIAVDFIPQILETLLADSEVKLVHHSKGWSAIAHEMVHTFFTFNGLLNNGYAEVRQWLRQAHSDFLDELVDGYNANLARVRDAEEARINEALAMIYDSFIAPRFSQGREVILRLPKYKLFMGDVENLIRLKLVPERFHPSKFGFKSDEVVNDQYYRLVLLDLARDGWGVDARSVIQSVEISHFDANGVPSELMDAIASVQKDTSTDPAMIGSVKSSVSYAAQMGVASSSVTDPTDLGGVDFTPDFDIEVQGEGKASEGIFPRMPCLDDDGDGECDVVDIPELERMIKSGQEVAPVILQIVPVTNVPLLLGVTQKREEEEVDLSYARP